MPLTPGRMASPVEAARAADEGPSGGAIGGLVGASVALPPTSRGALHHRGRAGGDPLTQELFARCLAAQTSVCGTLAGAVASCIVLALCPARRTGARAVVDLGAKASSISRLRERAAELSAESRAAPSQACAASKAQVARARTGIRALDAGPLTLATGCNDALDDCCRRRRRCRSTVE